MTRTTRKLIVAKLTALGGSRRIWSRWLQRAYDRNLETQSAEHATGFMLCQMAAGKTIKMARELLNS